MATQESLTEGRAFQRALTEVALDILRRGVGERISTSVQIQARLEVGSGTVQKALRQLETVGGVRVRVRGQQGTVIEEYDPPKLWHAADLGPLRLVLTPPGSIETAGLALEVRSQFANRQIPTEFDYIRGSASRIEALDGAAARVASVSRAAAHGLGLTNDTDYDVIDLGPSSYYRPDTLVILRGSRPPTGHQRIARDPSSFDHLRLTELEFPQTGAVEYVDCPFTDVPAAILTGAADAGIWHEIVAPISPRQAGLTVEPLRADVWDDDLTRAALVWRSEYGEIGALLRLLNAAAITDRQDELAKNGLSSPHLRDSIPWF